MGKIVLPQYEVAYNESSSIRIYVGVVINTNDHAPISLVVAAAQDEISAGIMMKSLKGVRKVIIVKRLSQLLSILRS